MDCRAGIMAIVILLLVFPGLYAQETSGETAAPGEEYFEQGLSGSLYIPGRKLIGDPYFPREKWIRGDVRLTTGATVKDKLLRYNGYMDELFWLYEGDYSQVKVDRDMIDGFILNTPTGGLRFTRITVHVPPLIWNREVLGQVMYEGDISLFCYRRVIETGLGDYLSDDKIYGGRKVRASHLYIIMLPCGKQATISRIRRSSILNLFPENRAEIRRLLRQNRLRPYNEAGLVEAMKLLDNFPGLLK